MEAGVDLAGCEAADGEIEFDLHLEDLPKFQLEVFLVPAGILGRAVER